MSKQNGSAALAVKAAAPQSVGVAVGRRGLELRTLDDMWRFATCVAKSGLAPKGVETAEAIVVAVQMGAEIGLTPMASLQNIAVINGRPSLWGDAMLAVCRSSGVFDESQFEEVVTDKGASCTVCRIGGKPITRTFSADDAKKAGLLGKAGPWSSYPQRMLQMRARSFALRDGFGDFLRGIRSTEEERDGVYIEHQPAQAAPLRASETSGNSLDALTRKLQASPQPDVEPTQQPAEESVPDADAQSMLIDLDISDGIKQAVSDLHWSAPNAAGKIAAFVKATFGLNTLDDCTHEQKRAVLEWLQRQLEH